MRRLLVIAVSLTVGLASASVLASVVGHNAPPGLAQQILADNNCPEPCWRGIRPGQSNLAQSQALLMAAGPLIEPIPVGTNGDLPGPEPHLCWTINVNPGWGGCLARDVTADGPVNWLELAVPAQANFTLGNAIMIFGRPQTAVLCPQSFYAAVYFPNNVEVATRIDSLTNSFSPSMSIFLVRFNAPAAEPPYRFDVPAWRGFSSWRQVIDC